MPVEQQQENEVLWYTNCFFLHDFTFGTLEDCDWIKEQDNAREDMEVRDIWTRGAEMQKCFAMKCGQDYNINPTRLNVSEVW